VTLSRPIEASLERALAKRAADTATTEAAIVAHVCLRQYGDNAPNILRMAAEMADESKDAK
jgi:hypothetical protein